MPGDDGTPFLTKASDGTYSASVDGWDIRAEVASDEEGKFFSCRARRADRTVAFDLRRIGPPIFTLPDYAGGARDDAGKVRFYGYLEEKRLRLEAQENAE